MISTGPFSFAALITTAMLALAGSGRIEPSATGQVASARTTATERPVRSKSHTPPSSDDESGEPDGRMPTEGSCHLTKIREVTSRLIGIPQSGTSILYTDGHAQVSYDRITAAEHSQQGDRVRLCVVSVPSRCPVGDFRGVIYRATNLYTRRSWLMPNAEHYCGGA